MKNAKTKVKAQKPKRSYKAVIESLRQVWNIEHVRELECFWSGGRPEKRSIDTPTLRVAVWNMCKGAGGRLFEHDYRIVCYRSDIVLTQEALLSERGISTFTEPGFAVLHAASYKRRDGIRDGVMTASRFEMDGAPQRIVCKYPEPIFQTPKVALVTFYRLGDYESSSRKLMVVNIHATLVRRAEGATEEILHVIDQLPQHDGPMIFAGDFNTFTPRYLGVISRALKKVGLELVNIDNDPRPVIGALDQVFVRGVSVNRVVVDTNVKNSDHFPLFLEVSVT